MTVLSPERARDAVRSLTSVSVENMVELGRGSDSVAYLVDDGWVFRFPTVPDAQVTLRREISLLPGLRETLPLRTPVFEHIGESNQGLLFVGYRMVHGVPLTAKCFEGLEPDAQQTALAALAGFLEALHAFPLSAARRAGVVEEQRKGAFNRRQRYLHRQLRGLLSSAEVMQLDGIFERYERDYTPNSRTPVLLHADLKPAHVIYDDVAQRIAGVLDWGDVCLGDPDFDLAVISMFFGERFLMRLLPHLPDRIPAVVLAKTQFFTAVRWIQDLLYDVARDEPKSTDACLRRLRNHLEGLSPPQQA